MANKIKNIFKRNKKKSKSKSSTKKNIGLIILMYLGIAALVFVILFIAFIIITAPKFEVDKLYKKESTVLLDKNGKEFAKVGSENRELVTYDDLPQVLVDAIIATEDARFFQHSGFDLPRFAKATIGQLSGDSSAGGASTLTMQISKNHFTSSKSEGLVGLVRKFTDIYMAVFKIEKNYTKEEIIEFYVNAPWLANWSYGVEQACQSYFGKSVNDLNLSEAALIAGMFQAPSSYNPYTNPENASKRRNTVLNLMVKHGYITESEKEFASSIDVSSMLKSATSENNQNPYQAFIDTVAVEVEEKTDRDPYEVPMIIHTTMDPNAQDAINDVINGKTYTFVNDIIQTAIAITDVNDGSIVAVSNGRNKNGEKLYNFATSMKRHPGSTAKPIFDYGPLMEFNNGSTYFPVFDEPMSYSNGAKLTNADNSYLGMLTAREALNKSRNIPAVQVFQQLDKNKVASFVHSLGIDYGANLYESAAIGGFDGVSPVDLSAAYASFARGGYYIEPYSFTKVEFRESGDVYEQKPIKEKVMSESTAYLINNMMITGNSVAGSYKVSGTDIGAKSGTSTYEESALKKYKLPSSAVMDNWLGVYTPDYSMAIWYGYEEAMEGQYVTTGQGATAKRNISVAIGNKVFKSGSRFKVPSGVVKSEVELETFPAMLPSEHTPSSLRRTEWFKKGTEPTEISPRFNTLENPKNGKSVSGDNSITITWDKIKTPDAIDTSYLQSHFNTYYMQWSEKYYNKRISYNNSYIGTLGYQVYLKNADGSLTPLQYTQNNSYTYNTTSTAQLTFVVKSAYSIFKNNMSTGLEIKAKLDSSNVGGNNSNISITKVELKGKNPQCIVRNGTYVDEGITVYSGNQNITSLPDTNVNKTYYVVVNGNEYATDSIKTDTANTTYKVKYTATYKGDTSNSKTIERTVNIANSCS